jgi:preprotein translocase subunit SecY
MQFFAIILISIKKERNFYMSVKRTKKSNIFSNKELTHKILFTLVILFIIQILSNIPTFGINREILTQFLNSETGNAFGLFAMFSGNSFSQMSIFVIGITPYISASIVLQLLRVIVPALDEMAKDGKVGQDKYKRLNYIVAGVLAIIQAIPITLGFASYGLLVENNAFYITIVSVSLVIGSIVEIFLGSLIDKKGLGNGISLILLMNILSRFPGDISTIYEMFIKDNGIIGWIATIVVCFLVVSITLIGIIYLQDGEKRVKTQYSSQVKGMKSLTSKASNFIPLKVNIAGVMPIIFTNSLFQMYILIVTLIGVDSSNIFYKISQALSSSNWFQITNPLYNLGFILYCVLIFAFAYFYSTLVFNPEEVADNLRKSGGVILGIRPGKPTEEYLDKKLKTLRNVGSVCLIVVTTIPMIISSLFNVSSLSFGGTSIIIVVGVILETYKIIESEQLESSSSSFLF